MESVDCPFCKIVRHEIGTVIWENDFFVAFNDINPKASTHVLIVPKKHIDNLDDPGFTPDIASAYLNAAKEVAEKLNLQTGYRLIVNNKKGGGQVVDHLHFHLLAGDNLPAF